VVLVEQSFLEGSLQGEVSELLRLVAGGGGDHGHVDFDVVT